MSSEWFSNFENESAVEFINDVLLNGYGLIEVALDRVYDDSEILDVIACEEALMAAEFVAAARNKPADDFPENAADWIESNLPPGSEEQVQIISLTDKAAGAIDLIVTDSELKILWEESPYFDQWFKSQQDLQNRLLD